MAVQHEHAALQARLDQGFAERIHCADGFRADRIGIVVEEDFEIDLRLVLHQLGDFLALFLRCGLHRLDRNRTGAGPLDHFLVGRRIGVDGERAGEAAGQGLAVRALRLQRVFDLRGSWAKDGEKAAPATRAKAPARMNVAMRVIGFFPQRVYEQALLTYHSRPPDAEPGLDHIFVVTDRQTVQIGISGRGRPMARRGTYARACWAILTRTAATGPARSHAPEMAAVEPPGRSAIPAPRDRDRRNASRRPARRAASSRRAPARPCGPR